MGPSHYLRNKKGAEGEEKTMLLVFFSFLFSIFALSSPFFVTNIQRATHLSKREKFSFPKAGAAKKREKVFMMILFVPFPIAVVVRMEGGREGGVEFHARSLTYTLYAQTPTCLLPLLSYRAAAAPPTPKRPFSPPCVQEKEEEEEEEEERGEGA